MKIKLIEKLKIPLNLKEFLAEEEYWEDDSFEPLLLTIQEIEFNGKDSISYQAEFEINEDYPFASGDSLEVLLRSFIYQKDQNLERKIKGDSESSTCVLWIDTESDFKKMLGFFIRLVTD